MHSSRWSITDEGQVDERYSNLAKTLGGCPDNVAGGRFKTISILNTATQEAFVRGLCDPDLSGDGSASSDVLLPADVTENRALDTELAVRIAEHQIGRFFSRLASEAEITMAETGASACVPQPCTAESFGRALCYALLSSSEMLFY